MPSPFPCSPVNHECLWKKTQIEKKQQQLKSKTYSYLIDNGSEDIKGKGTKRCIIKRKLTFEIYNIWKL